jgi:hypothetical protein
MSKNEMDPTQLVYFPGGRGVKSYGHQEKSIQKTAFRKPGTQPPQQK